MTAAVPDAATDAVREPGHFVPQAYLRRPPAEFRGLTRVLMADVHEVDKATIAAISAICAPLRARLASHPHLRREQVREVHTMWTNGVPAMFSLMREHGGTHKSLRTAEIRVCGATWRDDAWAPRQDLEPGLSLCRLALDTTNAERIFSIVPLAQFSAFAIARWFERTGSRDIAVLLRDIGSAATAEEFNEPHAGTGVEMGYPCPSGFWRGRQVQARQARTGQVLSVFCARTFASAESVPD